MAAILVNRATVVCHDEALRAWTHGIERIDQAGTRGTGDVNQLHSKFAIAIQN